MGGKAARIGDSVTCGDHLAQGSSNVFVNGLPFAHQNQRMTTGHGCFPPTILLAGFAATVFCNNAPVAVKNQTFTLLHICGKAFHFGIVNTGSDDVSVEE